MSQSTARLHRKLYRAGAIDAAMKAAMESDTRLKLERRRDGEHHIVTLDGVDPVDATELVAEVADLALRLTNEADRR